MYYAPTGPQLVGEVSLEAEDLAAELSELRQKAEDKAIGPVRTRLILPDDQIRYMTVETGKIGFEDRMAQARAALTGATPYEVGDLAIAVVAEGPQTYVAAVARETLQEAEAFAVGHGFDPVVFGAEPVEDVFAGRPDFGPTEHAATFVEARVEPPSEAADVIGPDEEPQAEPANDTAADLPEKTDDAESETRTATDQTDPDVPVIDVAQPSDADGVEADGETAENSEAGLATDAAIGFSSRRKSRSQPRPRDTRQPIPGAENGEATLSPSENEEEAQASGFASRRRTPDLVATPRQHESEAAVAASTSLPGVSREQAPDWPDEAVPAEPAMAAMAVRRPPVPEAIPIAPPLDEAQRLTVFGARRQAEAIGGKPRFLGLFMTTALLIFLAGMAAWATVFRDEGLVSLFFPNRAEPEIAEPAAPALAADLPSPTVDDAPSQERSEVELASLESGLTDEDAAVLDALATPRAEPETPEPLTDGEMLARYATTGIWPRAPVAPAPSGIIPIDDLYQTSIDAGSTSHDAVALISPPAPERAMDALASPAPSGTAFRLDPRGLVIPTPDGALNPDGIVVYAGQPPVLPPARPDAPEVTDAGPTEAEVAETAEVAEQLRLGTFRPKMRPAALIENNERATLGGVSRSELAAFRPRARPELERTEEEATAEEPDAPATAQAVAVSLRPDARPRNFARIVARAEPQREAAEEERRVAVVAPRTVTPKIPSSASVAREATLQNAIRLNRINLIGVYGKPSERRALVRLPSGRYEKVKVGDRLDGGKVSAIGDSELRYQKRGRNVVLKMPSG